MDRSALRRDFVTRPIYQMAKGVLPEMSATEAEAIAAARSNAAGIARIRTRIQPAPAIESSAYLLSQNLIGGVVSGSES